jgi:hypothetical protein
VSTYSTAGVSYGDALGTYGDLGGGAPEQVPTPTAAVGSAARNSVVGSDGRSTVTGPAGTTLTARRMRIRIRDRIG